MFGGFIINPLINLVKIPLEILPYAIEQATTHLWTLFKEKEDWKIIVPLLIPFIILGALSIPAKIVRWTVRAVLSPVKSFKHAKSLPARVASLIVSTVGVAVIAVFAPLVLVKLGAAAAMQSAAVLPHIASGVKTALMTIGLGANYFAAQALSLVTIGFYAMLRAYTQVKAYGSKTKVGKIKVGEYTAMPSKEPSGYVLRDPQLATITSVGNASSTRAHVLRNSDYESSDNEDAAPPPMVRPVRRKKKSSSLESNSSSESGSSSQPELDDSQAPDVRDESAYSLPTAVQAVVAQGLMSSCASEARETERLGNDDASSVRSLQ